jgi:putative NADH-flavin reductase
MNILVFGATGHCGKAFVRALFQRSHTFRVVSVFVRDRARAHCIFSQFLDTHQTQSITYIVGDIYDSEAVSTALKSHQVVVNYVSSYRPPHNQMSTLVQIMVDSKYSGCFVHFGYPRGIEPEGNLTEHFILWMTAKLSRTKYGPAIRDHQVVYNKLQSIQNVSVIIFAAPKMTGGNTRGSFYGGPDSLDKAIGKSRVWQSVSAVDAANLILDYICCKEQSTRRLLLCLAYR